MDMLMKLWVKPNRLLAPLNRIDEFDFKNTRQFKSGYINDFEKSQVGGDLTRLTILFPSVSILS